MGTLSTELKSKRRRRLLMTLIMAGVMIAALAAAVLLFRETEQAIVRDVTFDPKACVRLLDVSRVYAIEQSPADSDLLWFGTAEGIRVLNNRTLDWKRYGLDHGLLSETVSDICFDDAGVPWVGTWNGVARFDPVSDTFVPVKSAPAVGGERVLAVEYVPGYGLVYALDGRGLYRLGPGGGKPAAISMKAMRIPNRITCLKQWNGSLLIGAEDRTVVVFDPAGNTARKMTFERGGAKKTLVWDFAMIRGVLFAATSDDGIWYARESGDTLREMKSFPAKGAYVFAGEHDGFWVGTPFGLWRYYDDGGTWLQYVHPQERTPTDFQVFSLANAGDLLWYGSMEMGAGFLRKDRVAWQPLRAGLSNPNVTALAVADSVLWTGYGYQGGHLDAFTAQDVQYLRNYGYWDGVKEDHVQVLRTIGSRVYFGGYASFGYIDRARNVRRTFNADNGMPFSDVADIAVCADSTVLLAGAFGLLAFDPRTESLTVSSAAQGSRITALLALGDSVWCGTLAHGVFLFDRPSATRRFQCLRDAGRICGLARVPDRTGASTLFIATKEHGCFLLRDGHDTPAQLDIPPALVPGGVSAHGNNIMAAAVIDSTVWLGTRESGALLYSPRDGAWKKMDYFDGLVSDQVRSFADGGAHVWVGCYGGFNRIDKPGAVKLQ